MVLGMVQSTRENVRQYPRYVISCFVWGTVYCVAFPALLYIFGEVVPITSIVGTPEAFYETLQIVRFGFKVIFTSPAAINAYLFIV